VDQSEGLADLGVLEGAEPAAAGGRGGLDPGPDGLDNQDVGKAGDHRLAAGLEGPGLGAMSLKTACIQLARGSSEAWM
jgi:hypothetical protein